MTNCEKRLAIESEMIHLAPRNRWTHHYDCGELGLLEMNLYHGEWICYWCEFEKLPEKVRRKYLTDVEK